MPILHLIYIFIHIDPVFFVSLIVSMIVSAARIFKEYPAIRQFQLLFFFFLLLYKSITDLCTFTLQPHSAFNAPIITLHLYSLHLFSHQRC